MKRIITILLALAVLFTLSACSSGAVKVSQTEECIPSNLNMSWYPSIMESEVGYYYISVEQNMYTLRYYDKSSGEDIICCNKPECTHDGSQYCAATTNEYAVESAAMYDGAIYSFAYILKAKDEPLELKVFRSETDGTARSEVCTFLTLKNAAGTTADFFDGIIIHKGKAFIDYGYGYRNSDSWNIVGDHCYGKMMVDLSTGKYSEVPLPDGLTYDDIWDTAGNSCLDGDWLYFVIRTKEHSSKCFSIYRWNFVTGESEKLDVPEHLSSYTVNNGIVYYTIVDSTDKETNMVQIYRYYPETGKTEKFNNQPITEETVIETSIIGQKNNQPEVTTDRKYIYYVNYGLSSVISNDPESEYHIEPRCIIYSFDGKELGSFMLPVAPKTQFEMYTLKFVNGKVYYLTEYEVFGCSVEDIITGTTEWAKLYDIIHL